MNFAVVLATLALVPRPQEVRETGGTCPAGAPVSVVRDSGLPAEGYRLSVAPGGVSIASADDAGEFYARETLKQLAGPGGAYPCCEISDAPRYPWRGLMIDESRHFFGKSVVKRYLDI